jgi:phage terminase Nu1 subunit (DNA packaging protein)
MRGISTVAVSKAVKTKRIKLVRGKIDPAKADAEWATNTRPGQRVEKRRLVAPEAAPLPTQSIPEPEPNTYAGARARREETLANMAQMDFDLKMGVLVNAAEIREKISKLHTEAKTRLLGVASKCKARLPQLSAIDVSIIEDLIREALGEIASGNG